MGRIAIGILAPALVLLLVGTSSFPLVVAFTLIMGASQGVITLVRMRCRSPIWGEELWHRARVYDSRGFTRRPAMGLGNLGPARPAGERRRPPGVEGH